MSEISTLHVEGFKSLRRRTEIAVQPLTILAGANSSGKSSVMQPALLLKQTLETPYDPGALLLDGPHVRFTAADQLLWKPGGRSGARFSVGVTVSDGEMVSVRFDKRAAGGFDVAEMARRDEGAARAGRHGGRRGAALARRHVLTAGRVEPKHWGEWPSPATPRRSSTPP